jgi:dihydrofolate synthase/folylpolyglutamate synthase
MNYTEALEYIHSINWAFCKPGLERIKLLCDALGNPESKLKFIHVAGTNGKGSFCAMLESILRNAGYKTGLFTSPYIKVFNERMQVNGKMIGDDELAEITAYVKPIADSMKDKPTEFELITAIGFEYFKRNVCDVVILEAGMGGRLDSTNIITTPVLSVITGIALDHTAFLGDTVEAIAKEKAGIIKDGIPVLYGGRDESARAVIEDTAKEKNSEFFTVEHSNLLIKKTSLEGTLFDFNGYKDMRVSLLGTYQPENACAVLSAVDILKKQGFNVSKESIKAGLLTAKWPARFEILCRDPLIIFDGAHNPQGIDASVESIKTYFKDKRVLVMTGVLKDKDYYYIARRLKEVTDTAFVFTPENPRALSKEEYAGVLNECAISAVTFNTIGEAFEYGKKEAQRLQMPFMILGSLYTYAFI